MGMQEDKGRLSMVEDHWEPLSRYYASQPWDTYPETTEAMHASANGLCCLPQVILHARGRPRDRAEKTTDCQHTGGWRDDYDRPFRYDDRNLGRRNDSYQPLPPTRYVPVSPFPPHSHNCNRLPFPPRPR